MKKFSEMSDAQFNEYLQVVTLKELKQHAYGIRHGEFGYSFYITRQQHLISKLNELEEQNKLPVIDDTDEMVQASCGHFVYRENLMSASLGSSCPDCYDAMSD